MQTAYRFFVVGAICAGLIGSTGVAQDHHDDHGPDEHAQDHYVRHNEWKKGYHMKQEDWARGQRIDYHQYHLNAPPHGYEWREVDGNYVLAAVATGVIASVLVASATH